MTTLPPAHPGVEVRAPEGLVLPVKGRVAVIIGNWLEFYDFLLYSLARRSSGPTRIGPAGAALSLTLILMSIGSALMALTPSYAQIGLAAPFILLAARLIQGFPAGGEVGAATSYLLESAPVHRRASITAWQGHSQQLAIIAGAW